MGDRREETGRAARPVYELRGVTKTYGQGKIEALGKTDIVLAEGSFSSVSLKSSG